MPRNSVTFNDVIKHLSSLTNDHNKEGMKRFGINTNTALGISIAQLRPYARSIGKDHSLALALWDSKIHEARLLAIFIDNPEDVTEDQMDSWISEINSWDLCDQVCNNLFRKTPFVEKKIYEWCKDDREFVRRAGFSLIATLAVHDKASPNQKFEDFLDLVVHTCLDDRNFVKKSINWALRQIGKRNPELRSYAISCAETILKKYPESASARWIAHDALRELTH